MHSARSRRRAAGRGPKCASAAALRFVASWASALRAVLACLFLVFAAPAAAAAPVYVHARIEGVINPIQARHVARALERARAEHAEFLLLTLDTPGGLVSSMQQIVSSITNSGIPVVAFTEPRSAQATSAGAFILLAADVTAMAPGTRVGAAHPVAQGENLEGAMNEKATNSLSSLIRSLAQRRGRPADLAESMVRKSISLTAEEAHEKKLVELLAVNRADLLNRLEGYALDEKRTLHTRKLTVVNVELSRFDRALDKIADPTLTSILLSLGMLAILYELGSPGIGAGGAIGALLLVLGMLGSSVLPIEASALVLFVIGFAAIGLELKLPTHGVLGGAGVIALLIGGMLLVDPGDYFGGLRGVRLTVFVPIVAAAAIMFLMIGRVTRKALVAPPATGVESFVGKQGSARSTFGRAATEPEGQVFVDGARWQAVTEEAEIKNGERVEVVSVTDKPTRLVVRRIS
jgi:membrane-bound serine protease (ClpP class)